jgi:hypothetical protein
MIRVSRAQSKTVSPARPAAEFTLFKRSVRPGSGELTERLCGRAPLLRKAALTWVAGGTRNLPRGAVSHPEQPFDSIAVPTRIELPAVAGRTALSTATPHRVGDSPARRSTRTTSESPRPPSGGAHRCADEPRIRLARQGAWNGRAFLARCGDLRPPTLVPFLASPIEELPFGLDARRSRHSRRGHARRVLARGVPSALCSSSAGQAFSRPDFERDPGERVVYLRLRALESRPLTLLFVALFLIVVATSSGGLESGDAGVRFETARSWLDGNGGALPADSAAGVRGKDGRLYAYYNLTQSTVLAALLFAFRLVHVPRAETVTKFLYSVLLLGLVFAALGVVLRLVGRLLRDDSSANRCAPPRDPAVSLRTDREGEHPRPRLRRPPTRDASGLGEARRWMAHPRFRLGPRNRNADRELDHGRVRLVRRAEFVAEGDTLSCRSHSRNRRNVPGGAGSHRHCSVELGPLWFGT